MFLHNYINSDHTYEKNMFSLERKGNRSYPPENFYCTKIHLYVILNEKEWLDIFVLRKVFDKSFDIMICFKDFVTCIKNITSFAKKIILNHRTHRH